MEPVASRDVVGANLDRLSLQRAEESRLAHILYTHVVYLEVHLATRRANAHR